MRARAAYDSCVNFIVIAPPFPILPLSLPPPHHLALYTFTLFTAPSHTRSFFSLSYVPSRLYLPSSLLIFLIHALSIAFSLSLSLSLSLSPLITFLYEFLRFILLKMTKLN